MKRIIYKSQAKPWVRASDVATLLSVSRRNNYENGITGLLVYTRGKFLQVLEGLDDKVEETYDRIRTDPRHFNCELVSDERIIEPDFGHWSMGLWTDQLSAEERRANLVSVPELLAEFDSEWLQSKSELNHILSDELFKMRFATAA